MALAGGIALHANHRVMALLEAHDQVLEGSRLPNALHTLLASLAPDHAELAGLGVASTDNWDGLVDGLREAG